MKIYHKSLFIFRRDLRLIDNTGLVAALSQSAQVIPCFIFDPRQISKKNEYKSDNALQFMTESLKCLQKDLHDRGGKLYLFHGQAEIVVKKLITAQNIEKVFINRDYTPFSIMRDTALQKICADHGITLEISNEALLNQPEDVAKKDNTPYSKFSAFYKKAITIPIKKPVSFHVKNQWVTKVIDHEESTKIYTTIIPTLNKQIAVHGGSNQAHILLQNITQQKNYAHNHDYPALNTSHLSAHLKFGTISVRQVYHAIIKYLGKNHPLLRQLYWRDFFTHIGYHTPHVFGNAYNKKFAKLRWSTDMKRFKAWCEGKTGFPIVDAGMRELHTTGFMHNRVRMIVASFLVKDLHINWLWGEKYFAKKLVDYDPAVNNGNWQWSASTGCDAQPYFRIFNPWLQQKKYDTECIYIKKWVPELRNYDTKVIHEYFKSNSPIVNNYPRPILDHAYESKITKKLFSSLIKKP